MRKSTALRQLCGWSGVWTIFPVDPAYGMRSEVGVHRFAESRKEGLFAEPFEESETLELIFDRIFHLSKAQFNAGGVQGVV